MTTPLSRIPRPQPDRFVGQKKLFLVPNYTMPPGMPDEGKDLFEKYWSEVRDSITSLERSLGVVCKVYHELVCDEGEDGLRQIDMMNPSGSQLIRAMCQSTASLRSLEDAELVAEHTDWHRILGMGPVSQKVFTLALEGYQETLDARYAGISERISGDLEEGESAALFIREDHRAQLGSDVQVFFVAPPSLDRLKRWLEDTLGQQTSDE